MNLNDINKIQETIGIKLPTFYIDLITNYPSELLGTEAPDYGFLDDPEEIIELNNDVRENGYFGEKWPDRYFIVGHNGCGDYYVINHESKDFSVGFSDHEVMECNLYASSLSEFIEKLKSEME